MVSLEALATACGQGAADLPNNYTERWLSDQRRNRLLESL
jgi:hypothetical protein